MGPEAGRRVGSPELCSQIRYASESRRHLAIGLSLADWCCAGRANPRGWAGTAGGCDTRWLANLADLSDRLLGLRLSDLEEPSTVGLFTAGRLRPWLRQKLS